MDDIARAEVGELMEKYRLEIERQMGHEIPKTRAVNYSKEYQDFKKEIYPANLTFYEKACNFCDKYFGIKPDPKRVPDLQKAIETCHLNITPSGAYTFAMAVPLVVIVLGVLICYVGFNSLFFAGFFAALGAAMIIPLNRIPEFMATNWRMKASNQMVLCIFYVVTYLRHTSNLENAIEFAGEHLGPPLSLDLKKVLWDVETEEFSTVKESLENYLQRWRKSNGEFVEAFELIESSLYEGSESRRLAVLDKSLEIILGGTYEKMLHYAHDLKSPITMLNMLGIIMPILGLVILPLVVSFMSEAKWYHIAVLYNVIIPGAVYYFGKTILTKRPTGYGDTDITELNPGLKKYKNFLINLFGFEISIKPIFIAAFVFIILFTIGISPILIHQINPKFDLVVYSEGSRDKIGFKQSMDENQVKNIKYSFLDYKEIKPQEEGAEPYEAGPFGVGSSILSIFIILAFGISIGLYYKLSSSNVMDIRNKSKQLEKEFASALFQLGNRLGDGLPAELAFERVSSTMEDSVSGKFFEMVSMNIRKMGMSVEQAIFDDNIGAILSFPSKIIESSMKVLIQSIRKGPQIAARALMNISRYIKEIHKVDERLKDLLGEIISSMKSQISFMTPAIAGIVIGITSMISTILGKLSILLKNAEAETGGQMLQLFGEGIPTFYFMIIVGLYVVQIVYILTVLANGIENGEDKLNERYMLGVNMIKSTSLFCIISLIIMIIFNIIATTIIYGTLQNQ